jgi:FkbM family methyltransferase
LRDALRRLVRRLQIENSAPVLRLKRFYPRASETALLAKILENHGVTKILDVGANVGQFAKEMRLGGYRGSIVSFEPLSSAHSRLKNAAKGDRKWIVADRMAIGNTDGEIQLHISADSVSSSILPMLSAHTDAAPDSAYVGIESVPIRKLDDAAARFVEPSDVLFLKIDVQGAEQDVLAGARKLLNQVVGVHLELSLVACYENQMLMIPFVEQMQSMGFGLWSLAPGTRDTATARLLQVDALFFQESAEERSNDRSRTAPAAI